MKWVLLPGQVYFIYIETPQAIDGIEDILKFAGRLGQCAGRVL